MSVATLQLGQVIYEVVGTQVLPFAAQSSTEAQCWRDISNAVSVSDFDQRLFFADESMALNFLYDVKRTLAKSAQQEADAIYRAIQQRRGASGATPDTVEGMTAFASPAVRSLAAHDVTREVTRALPAASVSAPSDPMWGFGRNASGGANGDTFLVTTTADSGPGSLRDGIDSTPNTGRSIFFAVNGNIKLERPLLLKSNLSMLGPTFGIAGVRIVGDRVVAINQENIVIKNIGFRNGGLRPSAVADSFEASRCNNVFIDRCSFAWSIDECCSLTDCDHCTVQRSIIAYSFSSPHPKKASHAVAGIYSGNGISLIGNLFAHHSFRPNVNGDVQIANCKFYNYDTSYPVNIFTTNRHPTARCDLQRCEFRAGPSTDGGDSFVKTVRIDWDFPHTETPSPVPNRLKLLWHRNNRRILFGSPAHDLLTEHFIVRPNVVADLDRANANFESLQEPEIFTIDPAVDAGPTVPDELDIIVRRDYKEQVGKVLVESPTELIPNGLDGL